MKYTVDENEVIYKSTPSMPVVRLRHRLGDKIRARYISITKKRPYKEVIDEIVRMRAYMYYLPQLADLSDEVCGPVFLGVLKPLELGDYIPKDEDEKHGV